MLTDKRFSGWKALAVSAMVGGAMVVAGPAFAKTDMDKLTIGGDAKVKYEFRTGTTFGSTKSNLSAAASRVRINVGYDLTPDVAFFAQLQDSRKWGAENCSFTAPGVAPGVVAGGCNPGAIGTVATVGKANQAGTGVDLHQGYILVKNILHPGMSLKIGRQEIAFGDHRLFGSDTWSLVGNAFDGVRLTHAAATADVDLFWARLSDNNSEAIGSGTATGPESGVSWPANAGRFATEDQDIYGVYVTWKPAEKWTVEPYYFLLQDNRVPGTGTAITNPQAADQRRSTLGGRINGKAGGLDLTTEVAWQFGSITDTATLNNKKERINAHAETVKIGYTFEPVPMRPRLGFEFNYASGDNDNNKAIPAGAANRHRGNFNTFDNLFPTNHGRIGYMDLVAWKNMVGYSGVFDVKPSEKSKLEIRYSVFRLANSKDNWYRGQQVIYATSTVTNEAASLGQEIDVHYFLTFKEKFKVEFGYGHFFSGEYLDRAMPQNLRAGQARSTATFNSNGDQNWGYVLAKVEF